MVCRFFQNRRGQHEQRGQNQQNHRHTDQCAAADQPAQAADQFHFRYERNAECRREEGQAARQNTLAALLDADARGLLRRVPRVHLLAEAGRHQNRIVYRGAELDRADDDARHKRQRLPRKVRDAHVDHDRAFDRCDQKHRHRERSERQRDDEEHQHNTRHVDAAEVLVRHLDQVLCHRALTGDHPVWIILLDEGSHLVELGVLRVAAALIGGVDEQQLVPAGLEKRPRLLRQEALGDPRAQKRLIAQHLMDAVHLSERLRERLQLLFGHIVLHDDEVRGCHVEILFQAVRSGYAGQILRQRVKNRIVYRCFGLRNRKRDKADQKHDENGRAVLHDEPRRAAELRDEGAVRVSADSPAESHDERGQHRQRTDDAQQDAFRHHEADVHAQRQAHGAQREKAGDRRQRTGGDRGKGFLHRTHHRGFIVRAAAPLLLKAVQEEDREIHRHAELQNGRQRLGDVADLPEEDIRTEIVGDREEHARHEQQRDHRLPEAQKQDQQRGAHRTQDVERHLLLHQRARILEDRRHAADKAASRKRILDFALRRHRDLVRARVFKLYDQHGRAAVVVKELLQIVGQHFLRRRHIDDVARPHHALHALDFGQRRLQLQRVRRRHVLHRDHRNGGHVEIVLEIRLADHGIQILRQVGEDVVVDVRACRAECRGNQKQHGQKQHEPSAAHHPSGKMLHSPYLLSQKMSNGHLSFRKTAYSKNDQ